MISLPDVKCMETIAAVHQFVSDAPRHRHPLIEWQHNTGSMNWALNLAPLLHPALQSSYSKMAGHTLCNAPIFLNRHMTADLLWFADALSHWSGIHMLSVTAWDSSAADFMLYCDTVLMGSLAFWSLVWFCH